MTHCSSRPQAIIAKVSAWILALVAVFVIGSFLHAFAAFVLVPVVLGFGVVRFLRAQSRRTVPTRWPAILAGNGLVLCFLLSVLFLCFESYFRFFCDQTDALADSLVSDKWYKRHFQRNNFGVRDNIDYSNALTPGKRRITFVGDSFTAGFGVKDVESRFGNRIRQLHPDWEVHVIAQLGLDTSTELLAMHNLTVSNHYQLDQLVLIYNINDIEEVMPRWIEEYKKLLADPFRKSWLCRESFFVNLFYLRWQLRQNAYLQRYFEELAAAYNGPLWETEKTGLSAFINMSRIRGGRLLVVTFPFLHAPVQFRSAHAQLDRFWKEKDVPHLDLLPVFSNLPPAKITINKHDAHPNEYAHQLAAQAIDVFLKQQITNYPAGAANRH